MSRNVLTEVLQTPDEAPAPGRGRLGGHETRPGVPGMFPGWPGAGAFATGLVSLFVLAAASVEQAGEVAAARVGGCSTDRGGDAQQRGGVAAGDAPGGQTGPEPLGYLEGFGGAGGQEDGELYVWRYPAAR
jgi:hypothetical protein